MRFIYPSQSGARVGFYLSTNTSISTADTFIGSLLFSVWPAAYGATYNNINLTIPSTVSGGKYYVGMIIYANGSSTDSITYNNTAYLASRITVGSSTPTPGGNDYCRDNGPCSSGQGDCDSNSECASGHTCVPDVGANYGWNSIVDVCQ